MARVLMTLRGSVVNGADFGSAKDARDEANRQLHELVEAHGMDPVRSVLFDVGDICSIVIAEKTRGPIYALVADLDGPCATLVECSDRGATRAAVVRLVREMVDLATKKAANEAMELLHGRTADNTQWHSLAAIPVPPGGA